MIIDATRYAIGRMSYQVSVTCDWLRKNWQHIPESTRAIVLRDIKEAVELDDLDRQNGDKYHRLGHDCDRREWVAVLENATQHATDR